jgi:hypothetical protein
MCKGLHYTAKNSEESAYSEVEACKRCVVESASCHGIDGGTVVFSIAPEFKNRGFSIPGGQADRPGGIAVF